MLAVMEHWEVNGCHTDNNEKYLLLMICKLGLDGLVFYFCSHKIYTFFLHMCSLSFLLADLLIVFIMAAVWFLGPEKSPVSSCFILANASATYGAVPLPMMLLGLLNYGFEDTYPGNQSAFRKRLRNAIWTLLVWMLAIMVTLGSVNMELIGLVKKRSKALICKVDESTLITFFTVAIFLAVITLMLPFWSMIPRWVREANTLSEAREKTDKERSDFLYTLKNCPKTKSSKQICLEEPSWSRPPLHISLTLGFGLFWMPYLTVSVACLLFGFRVPASITVNILWLECANSLLVGLVFWVKSRTQGPHSHLPENVCSFQLFWHLSKGHEQLNCISVFNPTKQMKPLIDV